MSYDKLRIKLTCPPKIAFCDRVLKERLHCVSKKRTNFEVYDNRKIFIWYRTGKSRTYDRRVI